MKNADDVLGQLAAWSREEDDVCAAVLVGSQAARPDRVDELSDYDVVLSLSDPDARAADPGWVGRFGEVLVELPERFDEPWQEIQSKLVQYRDGTKIDFSLVAAQTLERIVGKGELPEWLDGGYDVLVDKDGTASDLPAASGRAHVPAPPSEEEFSALVEEFWWETLYVARNLVRGEVLPARYSAEVVIRFELLAPALAWFVQVGRDGGQPVGPHGKGLHDLLTPATWEQVEATMPAAGVSGAWAALFAATELFRDVMTSVADDLDLVYPADLDRDVSAYLHELRALGRTVEAADHGPQRRDP